MRAMLMPTGILSRMHYDVPTGLCEHCTAL